MAKSDLSVRSVERFEGVAKSHLKKGETVEVALPVWLGGTYMPFFLGIVVGVAVGSIASSATGSGAVLVPLAGGVLGGFAGNLLAKRRAREHPVPATRLQVYLAITDRRILVHENGRVGRPGGLRTELSRRDLQSARLRRGGFFRPTRLTLVVGDTEYPFEYSGLWRVPALLDAVGADSSG